jgi:hypothetical protein
MRELAIKFASVWVLSSFAISPIAANVIISPLVDVAPETDPLFVPSEKGIRVEVKDERPHRDFIGGALFGGEKGVFLGYATPSEDDLEGYVRRAADTAVRTMGMKSGDDYLLEIVIRAFRIDMYRLSGFSPMNCMAYGILETRLAASNGEVLRTDDVRVAFYDRTVPVNSMKEVAREALSRIYSLATWQATVATLRAQFQPSPDALSIEAALEHLGPEHNAIPARLTIFWLGLAGQDNEAVTRDLLAILRTSEHQRMHQAAAQALGMLEVAEARDDIVSILAGTEGYGGWDIEDNEQVWHLLHALALLGEKDLADHIPDSLVKKKYVVEDLITFHTTGQPPEPSAAEVEKAEKAHVKLVKKRRKISGEPSP